jgi:hypothetical protein
VFDQHGASTFVECLGKKPAAASFNHLGCQPVSRGDHFNRGTKGIVKRTHTINVACCVSVAEHCQQGVCCNIRR